MDDCWEHHAGRGSDGKVSGTDCPAQSYLCQLYPEPSRFPSGLKALGDYMHAKNATFGLYTAESPHTCGGYPGSATDEALDAQTFAEWGL